MTKEQRAEQLMAKGPIWLVRRVMELEQALSNEGKYWEDVLKARAEG